MVIGTLSHAKIILELLLQNDKATAFSEGGDPPLNPPPPEGETPPLTLINNEGEEIKNYFFSGQAKTNTTKLSILFSKYDIYHKTFLKLFNQIKSNNQFI